MKHAICNYVDPLCNVTISNTKIEVAQKSQISLNLRSLQYQFSLTSNYKATTPSL